MNINEAAKAARKDLAAALQTGVETISSHQKITFKLYIRYISPLDGLAYWVLADALESHMRPSSLPTKIEVSGSLHQQAYSEQDSSLSRDTSRIIFTPIEKIDSFFIEDPDFVYFGTYNNALFTFSRMHNHYEQSGIYHYDGIAVLPTMETQMINSYDDLPKDQILSNSMPLWITLKEHGNVYPAFLSPVNLKPPYISVEVKHSHVWQAAASFAGDRRMQLCLDKATVTLYGFSNMAALDFIDYVVQTALDSNDFGISNSPVVEDRNTGQVELNVLAQKKTIKFEVNYYQETLRDRSLKSIKEAFCHISVPRMPQ